MAALRSEILLVVFIFWIPGSITTDANECGHTILTDESVEFCTDTLGSYTCQCNEEFALAFNGLTCGDIDECRSNTDGCTDSCTNTVGSHTCSTFSETPRNRSARFGEEVDFRCSFPGATNIVWKVNDQLLNEIEDLKYNLDKENIVSILTITALKSYRIKCVAEFPSQTIRSQPAYLTVITNSDSTLTVTLAAVLPSVIGFLGVVVTFATLVFLIWKWKKKNQKK